MSSSRFSPQLLLLDRPVHPLCRSAVIVPARNEEAGLGAALDALAAQVDLKGAPLDPRTWEVLLLLNNCTDRSPAVARSWQSAHPEMALHLLERTFSAEEAHVGTARRLLMDTAWSRLRAYGRSSGILSTDSDTVVAPDWVVQNRRALAGGADAVGGVIQLNPAEWEKVPGGAQAAYLRDREYQQLQAELEDLLDPQAGDAWPRHREHFGASLACTPVVYERVGGLPPLKSLEDIAFVDALYRADARLRHEPAVRVFTSPRMQGRAEIGLSWQLRTWHAASLTGKPQMVQSCEWLAHRFRSLFFLRGVHRRGGEARLRGFSPPWRERVREALRMEFTTGEFLAHMDCDTWIAETFAGREQEAPIEQVMRDLREAIRHERLLRRAACRSQREAAAGETRRALFTSAGADPLGSGRIDAR